MDTQRLLLFVALSFFSLMLWDAWQAENQPTQDPSLLFSTQNSTQPPISTAPAEREQTGMPRVSAPEAGGAEPIVQTLIESLPTATKITIETDLLNLEIDTAGGDIRKVDLLKHGKSSEDRVTPFRLMDQSTPFFIVQSGIMGGKGTEKTRCPDHNVIYSSEQSHYTMLGGDRVVVPMVWEDAATGIKITKSYTFYRDSYKIDLNYHVENSGSQDWRGGLYTQLLRDAEAPEAENSFIYTYTGGVTYTTEEHYQKIDFDEMDEITPIRNAENGWVAMIQHYFLAAVVPNKGDNPTLYTDIQSHDRYAIGAVLPIVTVAAGDSSDLSIQIYSGPKDQDRLEELAEGLELTVDYGWLTFLAQPIFWTLKQIQSVVINWGFSIVLLTILIKLIFFKLSETSYRSMARMRKLSPRLASLKERFGDDRQKMNEAMMKMYKEEKVNPMGGCLPILVQIPVFIALYWVLLESVEIRQAPFMLWIQDLSAKDPYYILPLIMGASMMIQQKLNPAPIDPIQQKVMMVLPVVFTVFFAFFPAGLVLYWVVNNIISISQQWYITKKIEAAN